MNVCRQQQQQQAKSTQSHLSMGKVTVSVIHFGIENTNHYILTLINAHHIEHTYSKVNAGHKVFVNRYNIFRLCNCKTFHS